MAKKISWFLFLAMYIYVYRIPGSFLFESVVRGIGVGIKNFWRPLHLFPFYRPAKQDYVDVQYPRRCPSPLSPPLTSLPPTRAIVSKPNPVAGSPGMQAASEAGFSPIHTRGGERGWERIRACVQYSLSSRGGVVDKVPRLLAVSFIYVRAFVRALHQCVLEESGWL